MSGRKGLHRSLRAIASGGENIFYISNTYEVDLLNLLAKLHHVQERQGF